MIKEVTEDVPLKTAVKLGKSPGPAACKMRENRCELKLKISKEKCLHRSYLINLTSKNRKEKWCYLSPESVDN